MLKADSKARANSAWEQLRTKDSVFASKAQAFIQSCYGSTSSATKTIEVKKNKSPPEWMISLGMLPSKTAQHLTRTDERVKEDLGEVNKEMSRELAAAALKTVAAGKKIAKEDDEDVGEVGKTEGTEAVKRKAEMQACSTSGLDALLEQIGKKPKVNILDRSKKDWGEFKEDKGIGEELEAYKKSGDKYLDKVAFLQRADIRQYEKERDERLAYQAKRRHEMSFQEEHV